MPEEHVKQPEQKEQKLKFDMLKMYFGEPYVINDSITIHQPTIGEIIEFGEENMNKSISPFVTNPTYHRVSLWDMGVDWNKITDYQLFIMLYGTLTKDKTELIFGDLDFSKLVPYRNEAGDIFLFEENGEEPIIDEKIYTHIAAYLRTMFNQHPKVQKAKGKTTKQWIIEEDKQKMQRAMEEESEKSDSFLLPLISGLLNHPGFKYKKNELKDVGIVEFMDSVQRLQVYENVHALMGGIYSGMLDTSKMKLDKETNWLRDLYS